MEIFRSMCKKNGYTLDGETDKFAAEGFQQLYEERDENFGNARDVRNVFERAVARQADRVAALENPGKEDLMSITVADLKEDDDPEETPGQAIAQDAAPLPTEDGGAEDRTPTQE